MNRTLTYALLRTRHTWRPNTRSGLCWTCSVTGINSQQVQQYNGFNRAPKVLLINSARYASSKATTLTRGQRYKSKKSVQFYPPLEGEELVPPVRRHVSKENWRNSNSSMSIEKARLEVIASKPKRERQENIKRTPLGERKLPYPEQAGVFPASIHL